MNPREALYHTLSVLIALVALLLGLHSGFWGLVGTDPTAVTLASFCLALVMLLAGERAAVGEKLAETERRIAEKVDSWRRSNPEVHVVTRFPTGDDALADLTRNIPRANVILNTRISRDNVRSGAKPHGAYFEALKVALSRGAKVVDIASSGFDEDVTELSAFAAKSGCPGEYTHFVCDESAPCFLNFTILQYESENRELWLGWATSRRGGLEQPAFSVRDQGVVSYFKTYHEALRD